MNSLNPGNPTASDSECPKPARCLVEEVARTLSERPELRAVTLDLANREVLFAYQVAPGATAVQETEAHLHSKIDAHNRDRCLGTPRDIRCEECLANGAIKLPLGIDLKVSDSTIRLERQHCMTAPRFWHWHRFPILRLEPRRPADVETDWRWPMATAVLCGVAGLTGFILESARGNLTAAALLCYAVSYVAGGWFPARDVRKTIRDRALDVHFLMLAVAAGAAIISHWWEGAVLLFLFSFSGALEDLATGRTQRAIKSLFRDAPKEANLLDADGNERKFPVDDLERDMRLRVRPGEQFPVDAEVLEGDTAADESNLTGESVPVEKKPGATVLAGTLNLWGRVDCRVLRPASESALGKIIRLIVEARERKAPAQRFTDRFGTPYTYAILGGSLAMFLVWWLALGNTAGGAFYNAMTLLVVASPCALVLSIPSAILAAIAAGARQGVLFRGGAAIERLADINRVALDKTGTLTTGQLAVVSVEPVDNGDPEELLRLAAAVEQNSHHPLARAIVSAARERQLTLPHVDRFRSITGRGVQAETSLEVGGKSDPIQIGRRALFEHEPWVAAVSPAPLGFTEVFVTSCDLRGRILFRDEVRPESAALLERLADAGVHATMLTGDREESARAVAEIAHLSDFRAGLHPEDKVRAIEEWNAAGERVAMVGDGVNDAPSLAAADIGVAMGVRGSDAALEQADIVLMQDRLENFYLAYDLSRRARRIIRQNLAISLGVIIILVSAALGAAIPLTLGVVGHEGSTVIVVFNSLRLLRRRQEFRPPQNPRTA